MIDQVAGQSGENLRFHLPPPRHPVWFVLPGEMFDQNSDIWKAINKAEQAVKTA
jgi:hypothetical protein